LILTLNQRTLRWSQELKIISRFKQKILVAVGLKLFNLFTWLRKIVIFLFLFIQKLLTKVYKLVIKPFFFNNYLASLKATQADINESENSRPKQSFIHWLTNRSNLHLVVILLCLLVATNNIQAQNKGQADPAARTILFQMLGNEDTEIIEETSLLVGEAQVSNFDDNFNLSLRADQSLDLESETAIAEDDNVEQIEILLPNQEVGAIVQPSIATTSPAPRTEILEYKIEDGDILGSIAEKFGISVSTILWENNLTSRSVIKPGQTLVILPVTGLTHKVKSGDTLVALAKTYSSDEQKIIEYNDLESATDIQVGQTLIIPNGKKPTPIYTAPTSSSYNQQTTYSDSVSDQELYNQNIYSRPASAYGSHRFPWGQCTWYVAQRRYVPWSGNANQWIANARAYGYQIGNSPKIGAIIVTRESWYGHVAYVEVIGNGTVTFAESNYKGLGVITRRTLKVNDNRILGYIY
jgi:surface antigen